MKRKALRSFIRYKKRKVNEDQFLTKLNTNKLLDKHDNLSQVHILCPFSPIEQRADNNIPIKRAYFWPIAFLSPNKFRMWRVEY